VVISLTGNSIFSFEEMPVKYYGTDVYGLGMGETGSADLFRINPNFSNPSMLASTNKVLFSTAVSLGYIWYEDSENKFRDDTLDFPYFSLAVPLKNHRLGFSFNSISSGNLDVKTEEISVTDFGDTLNYTSGNQVISNLYSADFIYSLKNRYLNLGISLNYYLGHRFQSWNLEFEDDDYEDAEYRLEKTFKNQGFSIGISKKIGDFSFGSSYSSAVKFDVSKIYEFNHYPYADTLNLENFEIPAEISGGLTYKFLNKYKASFGFNYEMWENTILYEKNSLKLGFGIGYDPLSGYGEWYNQIPLRIGGYLRELPFEKNEHKIMENALTCGIAIPLKSPDKKIEISVKYLTRGNVEKHDLADRSLMLTIGVTGFDIFKKKSRKTAPRDIPKANKKYIR